MNIIGSQPITRRTVKSGTYGVSAPIIPMQPRISFEEAGRDAQGALLEHQQDVMRSNEANRFNSEWNSYPEQKVSAMVPQAIRGVTPDVSMFGKADIYASPSKNTASGTYSSPSKRSASNEDVMEKQRMLNRQLGTNLKVDGIDGPKTQKAMGMWTARQESDIRRVGAEETASSQVQAPAAQPSVVQPQPQLAQGGWGYNQGATDRMHQQWLNNELPEGTIPTAVYDGPPEGLAAKVAGWFR